MSEAIFPRESQHARASTTPIKVALVSCGLGHVHRGFEVSSARLYQAIKPANALEVRLFTGGKFDGSTPILNLPRDFLLNTILKPATLINKRRTWEFAYGIEQISFAFSLLGELITWNPDVVWTKEAPFAHVLLSLRHLLRLRFKIIFANGGGFKPSTYEPFDYVQHLHSASYNKALEHGLDRAKMQVLPNILPPLNTTISRQSARASFGYAPSDWVVLSVAAWNRYHKRIDYLIEEVASINDKNVQLLLCGHPEPDTASLKGLAEKLLGNRVQWHTLPGEEIPRALRAADVFVLPSVNETFGSASIEAAIAGVPVVAHPHGASKLLMENGFEPTDLSEKGNLARQLLEIKKNPPSEQSLQRLSTAIRAHFDEATFRPKFVAMVQELIGRDQNNR